MQYTRSLFIFAFASAVILGGCNSTTDGVAVSSSSASSSVVSSLAPANANIVVAVPQPGTVVTSPLTVSGEAKGTWYFEASFPVRLLDAQGTVLAQTPAHALGNWMTTDFVPFTAVLTFQTTAHQGTLVLEKDNPSGLPQNASSVSIPVKF